MLDLEFSEYTHCGLLREQNEDATGHVLAATPAQARSQGWLFAIADGMGGQDDGEVASRLAIDTVMQGFLTIPKGVMHASLMPRLIQQANAAVYEAGHSRRRAGSAMGTTIVACALRFDSAVIAHVGDSRCYLYRAGTLSPLTRDHTMVDDQVRLGILSPAEAASAPNRHVLTRALGSDLFVAADTITVNILPNDYLLLCSDGLHGCVPDAVINHTLRISETLAAATASLIAAANAAGGHDNVSVQLIHVRSVERMGLYRGRPYRLL